MLPRASGSLHKRFVAVRAALGAEDGANLVLIALMLMMMLGFTGLAVDGSNLYYQQQRMQIAADAAALAGARLLSLGRSTAEAESEAQTLAERNGAGTLSVRFFEDDTQIEATVTRSFDPYFAQIIGPMDFTVQATARAGTFVVGRVGNLLPMTITCPPGGFVFNQEYTLFDNDTLASGNFGWLSWYGEGDAGTLALNIADPSRSPVLELGQRIDVKTGMASSEAVRTAFGGWRNKTVTIPLASVSGGGSGATYSVCGFAQFHLTDFRLTGTNKYVKGKFLQNAIPGEIVPGATDWGSRDIRMVQ